MKLSDALERATPLPIEMAVGEEYCFHDDCRVSLHHPWPPSEENGFEGNDETVAEVWPAANDTDIIDGALLVHCRKNFEELLAFLKAACECTTADEVMDFLTNNAPDLIDRMEEVEGI